MSRRGRLLRAAFIILGAVLIIVGNVTIAAQADPRCGTVGEAGSAVFTNDGTTTNWFLVVVGVIVIVCAAAAWGREKGRREKRSNTTL